MFIALSLQILPLTTVSCQPAAKRATCSRHGAPRTTERTEATVSEINAQTPLCVSLNLPVFLQGVREST